MFDFTTPHFTSPQMFASFSNHSIIHPSPVTLPRLSSCKRTSTCSLSASRCMYKIMCNLKTNSKVEGISCLASMVCYESNDDNDGRMQRCKKKYNNNGRQWRLKARWQSPCVLHYNQQYKQNENEFSLRAKRVHIVCITSVFAMLKLYRKEFCDDFSITFLFISICSCHIFSID